MTACSLSNSWYNLLMLPTYTTTSVRTPPILSLPCCDPHSVVGAPSSVSGTLSTTPQSSPPPSAVVLSALRGPVPTSDSPRPSDEGCCCGVRSLGCTGPVCCVRSTVSSVPLLRCSCIFRPLTGGYRYVSRTTWPGRSVGSWLSWCAGVTPPTVRLGRGAVLRSSV